MGPPRRSGGPPPNRKSAQTRPVPQFGRLGSPVSGRNDGPTPPPPSGGPHIFFFGCGPSPPPTPLPTTPCSSLPTHYPAHSYRNPGAPKCPPAPIFGRLKESPPLFDTPRGFSLLRIGGLIALGGPRCTVFRDLAGGCPRFGGGCAPPPPRPLSIPLSCFLIPPIPPTPPPVTLPFPAIPPHPLLRCNRPSPPLQFSLPHPQFPFPRPGGRARSPPQIPGSAKTQQGSLICLLHCPPTSPRGLSELVAPLRYQVSGPAQAPTTSQGGLLVCPPPPPSGFPRKVPLAPPECRGLVSEL